MALKHHRDRHRLPRRHARRGHGGAGLRGAGPGHRPREDRDAGRPAGCRCTSPGSTSCCASTWRASRAPPGGCASPPPGRRSRDFGDVHFVCVEHPAEARRVRLRHELRRRRLRLARPACWTRPALVVGKSTVPVGSAERLAERLARLAPAGDGGGAGLEPGVPARGLRGRRHPAPGPDRGRRRAASAPRSCCARSTRPRWPRARRSSSTDFPTAELVKNAANSFLATKISFINAMAEVCEAAGGDVVKLRRGASATTSGSAGKFLRAGLGFGGGCLPKDIRAFMARAGELGADQALTFLREVDSINMRRRGHMVELAREACGGGVPRQAGRRARRHLQAGLRRRTRLPRAERGRPDPPAGRPGHRLRPQGHGQRRQDLPHPRLRAHRRSTPYAAPTSSCT